MPKQAPKTDRGHVAFLRRNKSGTVSQIQEKAKKGKAKAKSGPRFEQGEEVYFRRPGEDQKTKRGHIKAKTRTGWTIIGRPDGKVSAESAREVFVPDEHVLSKKQYEKRKAAKGTRTATSTSKREVSITESNRRAAVAAKRFPLSEEDVITHPKFQDMMSATVTSLATKNGIRRQGTDTRGGVRFSPDNLEYNDLVSDYVTAAANAMRRELAASPKADMDAFAAQLRGEESGSRIFATITTEGRGAVMRHLKERAERFKDTEEYQENPDDPGVRRRQAGTASYDEYNDAQDDGMFHFDFDAVDKPHLWNQDQIYDPTNADPYEQMRYREAVIEHFVAKLPPEEREVIERKYAIGVHLEPQTNSEIAETLKQRKIAYPTPGRDWNRQSVTPVHDSAITRLRTIDNVETLKEEYQRNVKPRLKKSLTAADFFRALREHCQLLKSQGPTRAIAPGIILRSRLGKASVTFDPKRIVASGSADFAKSYSSDLSAKNPGGRWITVKQGPLSGRHIFILPHKDGTATVLSGGGPAMRHKLLQPKKEEPAGKKPEAEGSKPSADKPAEKKEISEERRSEIESSRQQHRSAIKEERGKMADIVREHLGKEIELTEKDRAAIEKKVEGIADPRQKATERMRETFAVKKERDQALQEILQAAKSVVIEENPTATEGEKQPSVAAVVKAHAEDLLQHHYRIEALKREDRELGKLLKTNNEKRPVGDTVTFEPLSKDDLKKVIVDEDLRDKEMAAHYKLAATVRGYVDSKGTEHQAKGGASVERNLRQGGYEAVTGIVGEMTGNSIMTRATYDEIGARGAAVLANYYLQNSGVSAKKISGRLDEDLGKIGSEVAERAVRKGDEFMAMADKVKKTGYGANSLMEAAQARGAALKYVNKAYETYAQAQGALNQAAEMAYESANTASGQLEMAAASASTLDAKRRRLGLKTNDVKIEKDGDGFKMTVKPTAFEKLLHEQASGKTGGIAGEGYSAEDIKAHRANTDDFHPQGINEYTPPNKEGVSNKILINPSQQAAVRFIAEQKRVYLNYEAGTGKSLSVIAAKAHLEEQSGQQKKMIVSMPSPIMKNFAAEVAKFSNYKVAVIESSDTPEQRRAKYNSGPDTIVVVNHEKMNFDQKDIQAAKFHMVVADEAHTVTQREGAGKSLKSEGLQKVARQAEHYVAMSGTPTPADLSQLYFHANLMNPEKFHSQKEFMARFGAAHKGEGLKEKISAFMNKELGDHVITAKKGKMLKPDGKQVELRMKTHFAPLSDTQRTAYRETVAAVKNGEISQLQAENRMKGTLNDTHHSDNGKFEHIKKLIDHHMATKGPTEKVSLYVNSYAGADNIHEFLEKHYPDAGVVRFANKDRKKAGDKEGRNYTAKEKGGFVDTFKHDPTVRFGIHTMAGTTGLNVQHDGNGGGATTVIAVSSGEASYSTIDQFFSRGYRTGANRDVDAHMVLTDTPYDLGTKLRLDEKKAVGEMLRSMPEGLHLLRKAHVKAHSRRTASGAVVQVKEHDDARTKKPTAPTMEDMVKEAARWQGAARNVDSAYGDDKRARLRHSKATTKGDLDAYLMRKFGIDDITARSVSNHLTHHNIPADHSADPKDFTSEPWAEHLAKAHIKAHTRTTASGAVTTVKEHDDSRTKKPAAKVKKPKKAKRLADQLDAGIKDGSINKRIFLRERKALRESLKDTKKQLKTAGPRKHKQISAEHAAIAEKLGHYNEAYGKNEFLSPKQKAQLQWFQDKQKKVMPDNDHLLQAIAKLGGIRADAAKSQWGISTKEFPALTSTGIWGKPVLRQTGGWDPDKMAEMLAGNGFVKTDGGKHDYRDFEEKLLRAAAGEKIMGEGHTITESDAQAEENAYYENLRQSELGQAIEDAERPDYDDIGYKDCSQEEQEAFDAVYQAFMTTVTAKATRTFYDASVPF